jgi:two-component system, cell cycle sensor histidine kinase and response regulator CckA
VTIPLDYRALFEHAYDGMLVINGSLVVHQANQAFGTLVGRPLEQVVGQPADRFVDPVDFAAHPPQTAKVSGGGSVLTMRRFLHADGSAIEAEAATSWLPNGMALVVVRDVRNRVDVNAEREMAEREHRYRLLFEVTPLPACVYDVETFRFLAVNPAAVAHYGYSVEQFLAMTILDVRPEEDRERTLARLRARRKGYGGQMRGWGYRHRKADGTLIDVEIISHPFDFEGRSARIVVVNDVTEQTRLRVREREVEAQLLQAQKMEAVGRLAGGVAHDFNNLLSVVLSAAQSLDDELPAESPLRGDVSDVRHAVERGAGLTRRLLAFARKEVRAPGFIDVNEIVAGVERLLARVIGGAVRVELRIGAAEAHALADANQLEQVLVNLAINARDAMPRGGTLEISTANVVIDEREAHALGVAPGRFVSIVVADDGEGMDDATRARAFEPFYTTKGPHEGTGLGLATVYGIVRESMGAVTIASVPGKGTQVTVHLPVEVRPTPTSPEQHVHGAPRAPTRAAGGGRVLLVEDEPRVRAQARRVLERCGYSVIEAGDGAEGERQFAAHRGAVDVVVTDVMMPVLGGVEMVARLRAVAPEVPVVFVSGFTAEDRDLPLDARTAFVAKPYTIAMLNEAIATVVTG